MVSNLGAARRTTARRRKSIALYKKIRHDRRSPYLYIRRRQVSLVTADRETDDGQ